MLSQERTINIFKKILKSFSEKDLSVAQEKLSTTTGIRMRIPIMTSNEEVRAYIKEFELDKPENCIRFLVETAYAPMETICSGINDLKEENLKECVSLIRAQKEIYLRRLKKENPNFDLILDRLCELSCKLEDKIMMYVNVIRRIDNRTRWEILTHGRMNILEAMIINKLFALT